MLTSAPDAEQRRVNDASRIKRQRATRAEMEARAEFLIDYAEWHGPVTVRQLYYQAEVAGLPGIDKTEASYEKIQRQVLKLRRAGRLSYHDIADATRWMRKPTSYDDPKAALAKWIQSYRKNLWRDARDYVEVWCEKDALAGVLYPVTSEYDVPLMITRGLAPETFCFEAIEARGNDERDYYVYYLGDFDRAGRDAARSLDEKLQRFTATNNKPFLVWFEQIAVTEEQIRDWGLPTREPKRKSAADRNWPHPFACELDAIPADRLRDLVRTAIEQHLPRWQFDQLKVAEESEREGLNAWRGAVEAH
jgi:hypothetical protein